MDPSAEPGADPDQAAEPPLRYGRRPIVDGDPNWPREPAQPRDGVLEPEEPPAVDGADPSQLDLRDPEDIAAFERPAAGFDPDLFSIEIEPILDRRPARLARFEPYDAIGIRVGSFTMFPEAEFAFGAYDNLFRSSSLVRRDTAFEVRPTIRAVSNWRTHAMEFRATGISTFHNQFPGEDDRAYTLEMRTRLDITRRTNIETMVSREHAQELRGSINAASVLGPRAEIDTTKSQVAINHRFNRLSIQLRGAITDTAYELPSLGQAPVVNTRDNVLKEAALRATWLFKPTFGVFSELVVNERSYAAVAADGMDRDSTGNRVRAGVTFGTTSQKLRGEASIGHAEQDFAGGLPAIRGVIVDANLAWRISALTSLLVTAKSDISEALLPGTGGALSQTVGAELRHSFKRALIGTAGVTLARQDYEGIRLHEQTLTSRLGLEYFLNRQITLFGRYQHAELDSTDHSRNYNYDEVKVGFRIRQ